jgi:predicted dienelactone hydrolase
MKRLYLSIFFLFALITSGCYTQNAAQTNNSDEIDFSLPQPEGKFGIGRQLVHLTDESRNKKEIAVWIYYPTKAKQQTSTEKITPEAWGNSYKKLLDKRLGNTASKALVNAKTFTQTGADISPNNETFPVLIFAPGANWLPTDYSLIIENLVSYGYVVLAFASSPLSPVVQLSDGKIAESPRVNDETYKIVSDDFRFIVTQIEKLNNDSSLKIKGRLDLKRIAAFGHSIGGAAAISAAADTLQIITAINLDGDFSGETANAQPTQEILYLTTEPPDINGAPIESWDNDRSETRRKLVWEKINAASQRAFRVRLATMFHTNFQDAATLPPTSIPENLRQNRFGKIEGARGIEIVNDLILNFIEFQFKRRSLDDFLNVEKQYSEIRFEIKETK